MKLLIKIFLVGLAGVLVSSCEFEKTSELKKSKFLTDSIYSENLSEYRKHNLYLPKGFSQEKKYPIMYATDGNTNVTDTKKLFDSLIDNKIITPLIFVASFSNNNIIDSLGTVFSDGNKYILTNRYYEYVYKSFTEESTDTTLEKRFENHTKYFTEELIPNIEEKYQQNNTKNDRYFYGISNGASFGLSLLNQNPNIIGTYICFSTVGANIQTYKWNSNSIYPNLYLRYGSDEASYIKEDAAFLESKYLELNSFLEIKEYKGWHDNMFWKEELTEVLSNIMSVK